MKLVLQGGSPYTPFDPETSRLNYAATGAGVYDNDQLNSQRLDRYQRFDFRMDKKWSRRRVSFDAYIDVQNAFVFGVPGYPQYTFKRTPDLADYVTTDNQPLAADGSNAIPTILPNDGAIALPTVGFIVEF